MPITQAILERIATYPAGEPFTASNFAGLGSREAIEKALLLLAEAGTIEGIGHGLYFFPVLNRFGFKSMPSTQQIVKLLAQEEGAKIEVHGAETVRLLGLSTQMPIHSVFYTTGSSRTVHLGNGLIKLQHVAPRKMVLAGRLAGVALSALWYLGREEVTAETFRHIAQKLPPTEFRALREAKSSMPSWMAEALTLYEQGGCAHA